MKQYSVFALLLSSIIFCSSCATIINGSRYKARVIVRGREDTRIIYKGDTMGRGTAVFKVRRKEANKFVIILREGNCPEQQIKYNKRRFDVGACILSAILWGAEGVGLDFLTGAYWWPDYKQPGIRLVKKRKQGGPLVEYTVDYTNCSGARPQ